MQKVTAILTADWHLRDTTPTARTDDFIAAMWQKVSFVSELQKQYNCPVWHAGDLFNHWKPSPELLTKTLQFLPAQFYTIYGNHDLPQHSIELAHKCGINVLEQANRLTVLSDTHWLQKPRRTLKIHNRNIMINHVMTWQGTRPYPQCTDPAAARLLRRYKNYDLIVTGHNHVTFTAEVKGNNVTRLLVNPGSLTRMDTTQVQHKPCVFLYFAETNTVEQVFLPIKQGVITDVHVAAKKAREGRIDAFIATLNTSWQSENSFLHNLHIFMQENEVSEDERKLLNQL